MAETISLGYCPAREQFCSYLAVSQLVAFRWPDSVSPVQRQRMETISDRNCTPHFELPCPVEEAIIDTPEGRGVISEQVLNSGIMQVLEARLNSGKLKPSDLGLVTSTSFGWKEIISSIGSTAPYTATSAEANREATGNEQLREQPVIAEVSTEEGLYPFDEAPVESPPSRWDWVEDHIVNPLMGIRKKHDEKEPRQ